MAREHYDFQAKKWLSHEEWLARGSVNESRSDIAFPIIISDSLGNDLKHPATGLVTDSKSTFRRMTQASGCIEVGDQAPMTAPSRKPDPKAAKAERVASIKRAAQELGGHI
jgi:hypothetical protein